MRILLRQVSDKTLAKREVDHVGETPDPGVLTPTCWPAQLGLALSLGAPEGEQRLCTYHQSRGF